MPPIYVGDNLMDVNQFYAIYVGPDLVYCNSPFYFKATGSCSLILNPSECDQVYCRYEGNDTWIAVAKGDSIPLNANQKLYLKANYYKGNYESSEKGTAAFSVTPDTPYTIGGNIQSLNGITKDTSGYWPFLFVDDTNIVDFEKDFICTASKAANCGFNKAFQGCTSLRKAPESLIANFKKLNNDCFRCMFAGCTSITTTCYFPDAPLAPRCYAAMFEYCTNLVEAQELRATTLDYSIADNMKEYEYMFHGCTNLVKFGGIRLTKTARATCTCMFQGCTSLREFPALEPEVIWRETYKDMFEGCSSLVSVGEIKAITASNIEACSGMFKNCTSLIATPKLNFKTVTTKTFNSMFENCTSLTTVTNIPLITTFDKGTAATNREYYFRYMFKNTGLTATPTIPALNMYDTSYAWQEAFADCANLTSVPQLLDPEAEVGAWCFRDAFKNCKNLTTVGPITCKTVSYNGFQYAFTECTGLKTVDSINITGAVMNSAFELVFSGLPVEQIGDITVGSCGWYTFRYLTQNCTSLKSVGNLTVANSIDGGGFISAFEGCTLLETAGNISVSGTAGERSFQYTFGGCTNLETIGSITVGGDAGPYAFDKFCSATSTSTTAGSVPCESLTAVGDISVSGAVKQYCFEYAFQNCKNLQTSGGTFTGDTFEQYCFRAMYQTCTALTVGPSVIGKDTTTCGINCCHYMFSGCNNLINPCKLPSTSLANYCYAYMFQNCYSLEKIPMLPATVLPTGCYRNMFSGSSSIRLYAYDAAYPYEFAVPYPYPTAATSVGNYAVTSMFSGTGGTVVTISVSTTSTPRHYSTDNEII